MLHCIISFLVGAFMMICFLGIVSACKDRETVNKVHFYVAREKNGNLGLWIGKPRRGITIWLENKGHKFICYSYFFRFYNLNPSDYDSLKWEDEPIEVFTNMKN